MTLALSPAASWALVAAAVVASVAFGLLVERRSRPRHAAGHTRARPAPPLEPGGWLEPQPRPIRVQPGEIVVRISADASAFVAEMQRAQLALERYERARRGTWRQRVNRRLCRWARAFRETVESLPA